MSDHVEEVEMDSVESVVDDIDKIKVKEPAQMIDAESYKGYKVKLQRVEIIDAINWYNGKVDSSGRPTYNANSTEMMKKVEISTYPLKVLDKEGNQTSKILMRKDENDNEIPITVNARFNLQKEEKDGKVEWIISKAPRAKLWAFMRKMGATKLSELKEKIVLLDVQPSQDENDNRMWLRISI